MPPVPLCQHLKTNGKPCGAPALKHRRFCYFHDESRKRRRASAKRAKAFITLHNALNLPILEDANAVQVGLMETINALMDARITERQCGLVLYALQTASGNLKRTTFETDAPKPPEPWVTELLTALRATPVPNDPNQQPTCHPERSTSASPTRTSEVEGPSTCHPERSTSASPMRTSEVEGPSACHPERSTSASPTRTCEVEGPSVSSQPAGTPASTTQPSDGPMARSHDRTIPKIQAAAEPPRSSSFGSPDLQFFDYSSVHQIYDSSVSNGTMTRSPNRTIPNTP